MASGHGYLVIGGDSLVGKSLVRSLELRGHRVLSSTRRSDTLNKSRLYLDFQRDESFEVPNGIDYVFVVAAATNYERCESDPLAQRINVELIPRLVLSLLKQRVFVTFISTNAVFGGERPWPQEDDPHAPSIPYAWQKSQAEKIVSVGASKAGTEDHLNIVRLTKILDSNTSPLPAWFLAWSLGEHIQPFSDLIFAPISVKFAGDSLAAIGECRVSGNLHISGAENISYVDLAGSLARDMAIDPRLLKPTTAVESGVHIPFKPRYSGLGMVRTTQLTGLKPQSLGDVALDLLS